MPLIFFPSLSLFFYTKFTFPLRPQLYIILLGGKKEHYDITGTYEFNNLLMGVPQVKVVNEYFRWSDFFLKGKVLSHLIGQNTDFNSYMSTLLRYAVISQLSA